MGKIKQGILGGFNGTTGSVVGASWKGIAYMRGKAQSIKNPRTASQQSNRSVFGAISEFASKNLALISIGFFQYANKMSAYNAFVQYNKLHDAFYEDGEEPNVTIAVAPAELTFARGNGYGVQHAQPTYANGAVTFSGDSPYSPSTIRCIVVNPDTLEVAWGNASSVSQGAYTKAINIPSDWTCTKVYCYAFANYQDPATNLDKVQPSEYLGEVNIA